MPRSDTLELRPTRAATGAATVRRLQAQRRLARALLLLSVFVVFGGCGKEEPTPAPAPEAPGAALADQVRVRHILVQYAGAEGARPEVTRSKAAADSLVRALRERVLAGEDFGGLAREFSDDASREEGGEIAPLQPGDVPPEFDRVARALKEGETSEVFASQYGFHLVQRLGAATVACQHILIRYHGAAGAPDSLLRSRAEALALVEKILAEVRNPQVSFPVAAAAYSDDILTASRGGYLGVLAPGKMVPAFDQAAFALEEGQTSGIVETQYGFHIIRRVKPELVRVSHILITHAGSNALETTATRGRDEALQVALDVLFRARKGEDFAELAREYSDDRMTAEKGGRLPMIDRGQTVPQFEEAVFSLAPGEISDVVETQFGFHVIKRLY